MKSKAERILAGAVLIAVTLMLVAMATTLWAASYGNIRPARTFYRQYGVYRVTFTINPQPSDSEAITQVSGMNHRIKQIHVVAPPLGSDTVALYVYDADTNLMYSAINNSGDTGGYSTTHNTDRLLVGDMMFMMRTNINVADTKTFYAYLYYQ